MSRKPQHANFAHWNRFPLLDFGQCAMLLLNLEPGRRIEKRSMRDQYDRLWQLIESSRSAGSLEGRYPYHQDIEPSKFIEWAKSMDEPIPEDWKPIGAEQVNVEQEKTKATDHSEKVEPVDEHEQDKKPEGDSQVAELREAALLLCVKKVRAGVSRRHVNVRKISAELYDDGRFENGELFSSKWRTSETIRGFLKGANNPKLDPRYKKARPEHTELFN